MGKSKYGGRIFSLILCTMLMAGCASNSTVNKEGNEAESSDAGMEGQVKVLYEWPQDESLYARIVESFNKEYPNIKLEFIRSQGGDYLNVLVASGEAPDIVTSSPNTPNWIANGLIKELSPYLEADSEVNKDVFYEPAYSRHATADGKIWGLPWQVDPNFVLVYNQEILEQHGISEIPEMNSLAEFGAFLQQFWIVENGEQVMTTILPHETFGALNTLQTYAYLNGATTETFYDPASKKVNFNDPLIVKALEFLVEFKRTYIDDQRMSKLNATIPEGSSRILGDKAAVDIAITGWVEDWVKQNPNLKFQSMPAESLWLGGSGLNMVASKEENKAAWIVLKWLTSSNEGAAALTNSNFVSGKVVNPVMEEKVGKDPVWQVTHDILTNAKRSHLESWIPVDFSKEFNEKWQEVIYKGTLEPKAFLDHMTKYIQALVDEMKS